MDSNHILRCLIETVAEVQELSGCAAVEVTEKTRPIYDLDGFDSLRGVEATVLLAAKLNCGFKAGKGDVNIFISKDGRRALCLDEAVRRLAELQN